MDNSSPPPADQQASSPSEPPSNVGSHASSNSRSSQKHNRDESEPTNPAAPASDAGVNNHNPDLSNTPMDEPHTPENQQQRQRSHQRYSSEDLLAPSSKFNKQEFQDKCLEDIEETGAEQQALMDEYAQWDWLHKLWAQSRSNADTIRLRQEVATISRWTELKEQELEEARIEHKRNLEKISQVLGIRMS